MEGDILNSASPDGVTRRQALERILQLVRSEVSAGQPLSRRLTRLAGSAAAFDSQERCRELGAKILLEIVQKTEENDPEIVENFLPMLARRLAEGSEQSEEVRLLLVAALRAVIEKPRSNGGNDERVLEWEEGYLEVVVKALAVALFDQHPEVVKESCSCVCSLAASHYPGSVSGWADMLVEPLIKTMSHRHARVRTAAIRALGATILRGGSKDFIKVWLHFAQRLLDHSPIVRQAVIEIAWDWILELPDRHSYYSQLISLILTGLSDDVDNIQQLSMRVWYDAGRQYETDNEAELKEQLEYEKPVADGYPEDMPRSPLGCRALVRCNLACLLPAVFNDLKDWKDEARIKAANLLYMLLLHSETHMMQHVPTIIDGMVSGCNDDDPKVRQKITEAANLVGHFVPARVWHTIILDKLADDPSVPKLAILAALLRGCKDPDLWTFAADIVSILLEAASYHFHSMPHQEQILNCIEIMLLSPECNKDILYPIFQVLLALLSSGDELRQRIYSCFDRLLLLLKIETKDQLFAMYAKDFVRYLCTNLSCDMWNIHSSQFVIFKTFLMEAGRAAGSALVDILTVFTDLSQPAKDVELKFYLFQAISHLSEKLTDADCEDFAIHCLRDCVLPNLDWKPGKASSVVRAAVATCLVCLLQHINGAKDEFVPVFEALISKSSCCLADDHATTRLAACQILDDLMRNHASLCKPDVFLTLSAKLAERLDDKHVSVRLVACQALGSCFRAWMATKAFDRQVHGTYLESHCGALMLYLDDSEVRIQSVALETLKVVSEHQPDIVSDCIEKAREKQKNQAHLEDLMLCLENSRTS